MGLFTTVPDNFFSLLSGKNKEIYAMALAVLYNSLQADEMSIRKDDYLRTLKETAADLVMRLDFESENPEDIPVNPGLPARVGFIVRRLEETGWIDLEIDPDNFGEYIALPSYSIQFLTLIHEVIHDSEAQYSSLVHSTYSELKLEDEERDEFMYATLLRVYENTKRLRVELVTLGHSIRIYQNRLGKFFTTNLVLEDYFDEYKVRISDRLYHPLKTFDSVTRFKRPIIAILQKWLKNDSIRAQLVSQAIIYSRTRAKDEAEREVIAKINYVSDMYEQLNALIGEIDQKHSDYTKSSATKILYLNNADKTIRGHLEKILKTYAQAVSEGTGARDILGKMQESLSFYDQGFIDPESLTLPVTRQYRGEGSALQIVDFEEASEVLMRDFLDETRNSFTDSRIYAFMETAFGSAERLKIEDIPLPDYDAFILLILATLKKDDDKCFYTIEIEDGKVVSHGYVLPRFTFIRKERVA
jgi:hypothetical protein